MPTDINLRSGFRDFAELEHACRQFTTEVNNKVHRATRRRPVEALAEEAHRLHRLPENPFTAALGTTRKVAGDATISVDSVRYSVPHRLVGQTVWARFHCDELVVTAVTEDGAAEAARHRRSTPDNLTIKDGHYPPRKEEAGE